MKPRPRTSDSLSRSKKIPVVRPQWDDSIFHRPDYLSISKSHGNTMNPTLNKTKTTTHATKIKSKIIIHESEDDAMSSSVSSASCSPISPPYYSKHNVEDTDEEERYYIKFNTLTVEQVNKKDILKSSRSLAAEMGKISEEIVNPSARYLPFNSSAHILSYGNLFSTKMRPRTTPVSSVKMNSATLSSHPVHCTCEKCRINKLKFKKSAVSPTEKGSRDTFLVLTHSLPHSLTHSFTQGYFKIVGNVKLVQDIFECHNLKQNKNPNCNKFNVLWSSHHLKGYLFKSLDRHQRINLFPHSWECTRKDALAYNLNRMSQQHGHKHFDFFPQCYVWPKERELIVDAFHSHPNEPWIIKPAGSSQGRGRTYSLTHSLTHSLTYLLTYLLVHIRRDIHRNECASAPI